MAASYSDQDKAIAIEIIERFGGTISQECLTLIRQALAAPKLNKATVWRWWNSRPVATGCNPHDQKKAPEDPGLSDQDLDELFEQIARKMLSKAMTDDIINGMKGRELVTAAAIAVDKMRLLRNMPTEIVEIWPGLMQALADLELNPADVFNALIAQARAEKVKRDGH